MRLILKLFFAFCVFIAVLFVAGLYQLSELKREQAVIVENDIKHTARQLADEINYWSEKQLRRSQLLSKLDGIANMLPEEQQPLLIAAVDPDDWSSLFIVVDAEGNAVSRSDKQALRNYSSREYVKQVLAGERFSQQVLISQTKPIPLQCFSVPIYSPSFTSSYSVVSSAGSALNGALIQCATLEWIVKKIAKPRNAMAETALWLVDENNRLLAHGDQKNFTSKLQDFSDHPILNRIKDGEFGEVVVEGRQQVAFVSTAAFGWRLVVQQDYQYAYGRYKRLATLFIWMALSLIVVAAIMAALLASHITTPIKDLVNTLEAFSKGRFSDAVPYLQRQDAVGDLAKSIDRIGLSLRLALKRIRSIIPPKISSKSSSEKGED